MPTTQLTLETRDGPMPAYQAAPDGEARGGVVVIQEAFGVTSHIEDVCRRLAAAGWVAVAPSLFHRQGSPVLGYADLGAVMPIMGQLTADGMRVDVDRAFDHLGSLGYGPERSAIVGFCMGGSVTFHTAVDRRRSGAAVGFYGGGVAEGRFGYPLATRAGVVAADAVSRAVRRPRQGHPGRRRRSAARRTRRGPKVPTEIIVYADADHGFNCDDRPAVFNPTVAAMAWDRTLAWFDEHVARA